MEFSAFSIPPKIPDNQVFLVLTISQ